MNKIVLIGRLVADPELSSTPNGIKCCKFRLAVSRRFKRDETDFFPVTVWRDAAEHCNKYLAKGSQVGITGELQMRYWEDRDGGKRLAVDVVADEVAFLSKAQTDDAKCAPNEELEEVEVGNMPF